MLYSHILNSQSVEYLDKIKQVSYLPTLYYMAGGDMKLKIVVAMPMRDISYTDTSNAYLA